jgi:hypothetical protein
MANLKISQLPVVYTLAGSDVIPTVANGVTSQISSTSLTNNMINTIFSNNLYISGSVTINTPSAIDLVVTGSQLVTGSLNVTGSLTISGSNNLVGIKTITGSVFISGSKTIIGNNIITGSLSVTGSVSIYSALTLFPLSPLPSGLSTGSLATSGSSLYFYNGTGSNGGWAKII